MTNTASILFKQWKVNKRALRGPFQLLGENTMAVKSWYLSVVDTSTHKPIVHKMFFTAPEMNKFIKEKDILENYPKPAYYIIKENY
jgi:hypothetical protein